MSLFRMELDFSTFFTEFSRRRFRCTIASILKQKRLQRFLFFFWRNPVFRLGAPFSASVSKNFTCAFCGISAEIMAFPIKKAAVNLNSQQNFYDNGALSFLRRLTAVSAELPAILEKQRRISEKFDPGGLIIG